VKIGFEWSHRALAGSVALAFAGLAFGVLRDPALRRPLRPMVLTAGVLLVVQVILGALTVWQLLASWTVSSHLVVGNSVNAGFAVIAWRLGRAAGAPSAGNASAPIAPALRALVLAIAVLLLVQLVLGGQVSSRFAGLACDEWPACHGGVWFPDWGGARGLHLFHRWTGYALVAALAAAAFVARGTGRPGRLLLAMAAVGVVQAIVGIANVLLRIPIEVTGAHSLLAAVLVLLTTLAVCESFARRDARATAL
jgi:cytochrome c oxidase assembly protein subunit 15